VSPGIAGKGNERLNQAVFDGERVQINDSKKVRPGRKMNPSRAAKPLCCAETTKPADDQTAGGLWKWARGANLQTPQTVQTSVCSRTLSKGRALASRMRLFAGRTHGFAGV
jgi:hypothetical protein